MAPQRERGAFVYQGAGRRSRQDPDAPPEQTRCAEEAIRVQRCMARNNHKQQRCTEDVEAWKRCTKRVKEAAAASKKA